MLFIIMLMTDFYLHCVYTLQTVPIELSVYYFIYDSLDGYKKMWDECQ